MAFGLTPFPPFPPPDDVFPVGIQIQANGEDVGPPNPQFVSFNGDGVTGSYDPDSGTANIDVAGAAESGGTTPTAAHGFRARLSAVDQQTGQTVIFGSTTAPGFLTDACYNIVNGIFVCPAGLGGLWRFAAGVEVSNAGGEGSPAFVELEMLLGITAVAHDEANVGDSAMLQNYAEIAIADGDQVTVRRAGASWSATVRAVGATYSFFSGVRVGDVAGG